MKMIKCAWKNCTNEFKSISPAGRKRRYCSHKCKTFFKNIQARRYYKNNKKKCSMRIKKWAQNNPKKRFDLYKKRYEKNKKILLEYAKKYFYKNIKKVLKTHNRWNKRNRNKCSNYAIKTRYKKKYPNLTPSELERIVDLKSMKRGFKKCVKQR